MDKRTWYKNLKNIYLRKPSCTLLTGVPLRSQVLLYGRDVYLHAWERDIQLFPNPSEQKDVSHNFQPKALWNTALYLIPLLFPSS